MKNDCGEVSTTVDCIIPNELLLLYTITYVMESIQHMIQEARAVQNKVAAKHFKCNNMILEESGFMSYVWDALEIRQSNLIDQLIRTLYPKERQRQVNIPVEDCNGCDEEVSDLNSTSETIIYNSPTEISDCGKFC